jgi:hypothetical protein
MFSLLLLNFDFSKIEVVIVVVTGPTGWLTYKRRTSMFVSFFRVATQWLRDCLVDEMLNAVDR